MKVRQSEFASRLSIAQMRMLVELVGAGSFSVAAKRLGVSQPSVSNALRALEGAYNVRLIDRVGTRPTPLLASLLPDIRVVLTMTEGLERSLRSQQTMASGNLRLSYSTYQLAMPWRNHHPGRRDVLGGCRPQAHGPLPRSGCDG